MFSKYPKQRRYSASVSKYKIFWELQVPIFVYHFLSQLTCVFYCYTFFFLCTWITNGSKICKPSKAILHSDTSELHAMQNHDANNFQNYFTLSKMNFVYYWDADVLQIYRILLRYHIIISALVGYIDKKTSNHKIILNSLVKLLNKTVTITGKLIKYNTWWNKILKQNSLKKIVIPFSIGCTCLFTVICLHPRSMIAF